MKLSIQTTKPKEVIDITNKVQAALEKSDASQGICNIYVAHTTCALTTMDLDPGTDVDFLQALDKIFPSGNYHHPHDPSHVGEHIMASIIGPSVSIPFINHKLILGTWQRVVLVELSGPRDRNLIVSVNPL